MNAKKTFLFNLEWYEVLRGYAEGVRMEVYEAIMEYAYSGTIPELGSLSNMAFSFIKREMDYNREQYEATVAKRQEAGRLGGRPKKQMVSEKADGFGEKQKKQMVFSESIYVNDNVYDNDNVNDNENEEKEREKEREKEISSFDFDFDSDDRLLAAFEQFRQAYPGQKRGAQVEFDSFVRKYPRQWRRYVPELAPALEKMLAWRARARKAGEFVPELKHLSTWLNNRCWTDEYPDVGVAPQNEERRRLKERERQREQQDDERRKQLRARYRRRVPDASTDQAPMDVLQYEMMGFDSLTDEELGKAIERINEGALVLPTGIEEMLKHPYDPRTQKLS